jgi:hypothetical protein
MHSALFLAESHLVRLTLTSRLSLQSLTKVDVAQRFSLELIAVTFAEGVVAISFLDGDVVEVVEVVEAFDDAVLLPHTPQDLLHLSRPNPESQKSELLATLIGHSAESSLQFLPLMVVIWRSSQTPQYL